MLATWGSSSGFNVASLFSAGEQGAWYDPSDINSYMSGLGSELVTNGTFTTNTVGWTVLGNATFVSVAGQGVLTVTSGSFWAGQSFAVTSGSWYEISADFITKTAAATAFFRVSNTTIGGTEYVSVSPTVDGTRLVYRILATAPTMYVAVGVNANGYSSTWDNISVKEVTSIGNATMFTTSTGTTPVTAVEQAVGLILDKSQGAPTLGPELVTNTGGPFINTTGWSGNQATLSVVSGKIRVTATATGFASAWIPITVPVGSGSVSINIVANNGTGPGAVTFALYENPPSGSPIGTSVNLITSATNIIIFTTTDGNIAANVYFAPTAIGQYIEISSASIKRLPGNHAYQSTDASRPTLRARYNLVEYSEQFDNAYWTKDGFTAANTTATTDPLGGTTADICTPTATNSVHRIYRGGTSQVTAPSCVYTLSVKANGYTKIGIRESATSGAGAAFDLAGSGSVIGAFNAGGSTVSNMSISSQGNGWFRIALTISFASATAQSFGIHALSPSYSAGSTIFEAWNANGTDGYYIWGAQLVPTAVFPNNTYQRIAAATDYATGPQFPQYLAFDGTDDSLLTNSVDFSATDKMSCWVGVTKQDTDDYHCVVELGTDAASVAGTFNVWAPWAIATGYGFNVRGATNVGKYEPVTYSAPTTNVLFGGFNLAGATLPEAIIPRVNGVVDLDNPSATVPGGGNFINTPLYIGRRNNSTFPLNGRIYSLIIRGAASNATQISATEAYVASKTGVAL